INGQTLSNEECSEVIAHENLCFALDESVWKLNDCFGQYSGPARQIAEKPFHIRIRPDKVLGIDVLEPFAVYLANLFFLTSDAYVRIGFNENVKDVNNAIIIQYSKLEQERERLNLFHSNKCFIYNVTNKEK
ncbi:hypothetical protein CAPTEDRAFT_204804, partial [Capitella teleta]